MMAVAETTSSCSKSPGTSKARRSPSNCSKTSKNGQFHLSNAPPAQWIRAQAAPDLGVFCNAQKSESGFLSGGGFGITYGKREQSLDQKSQSTTAVASTVGAITGNITAIAGNQYKQVGSDLIAPAGDINITAKKVDIIEARETSSSTTEQKFKQTGLTLSISSPVISAIQQGQAMAQAASQTSSGRMQALAAASTALNVYNNAGDITKSAQALASGNPAAAARITLSLGTSKSQSNSKSQSDTARGSSIAAGNNINITATALRQAQDAPSTSSGRTDEGNILIQGSSVKADNTTTLTADNNINLLAAKNESSQTSTNSSSSGSLSISWGAGGWGAGASASKGKGKSDGEDNTFTNTNVSAGNTATIKSGGDTNVIGAVVEANQIKADIGGSLKIESLQDKSTYSSSQQNVSGSVSVGGGGNGASVSASKSNVDSSFQSVGQQSGLKAGDGGFQVSVNNNTALTGAVIASTQTAVDSGKNSFTTGGSLSITDIQNTASFKGSGYSVSASFSQSKDANGNNVNKPGGSAGVGSTGGNASSTTTAGISGIAGNTAVRTGDAETGLQRIFNADKVQREINAQIAITQAFSKEAPKAVATFSDNQARDLRKAGKEEEAKKWDEGGRYRVVLHTLAGAFSGGASGAAGAAVSASAAPLMNQLQDGITDALKNAGLGDTAAKGVASGIAGLTAAGVGAAVGGAQGAATAFTVDTNNRQLHPTEIKWVADNRKAFADKLSKELGRPVTEQEAMYWLTAAGESNVDAGMQRSNAQFVRGTSNTEDARAYDNAKAFIAGGTKTNSSFTDERGQMQNLFSTTSNEFYKPEVYSQWKNDANYRDYYWSVMGINLKGDKLSSAEQAIYDQRQAIVNEQTIKQLALFGVQALAGKIASNVALKAEQYAGTATKTSAQEFTPAPGKSVVTPKAEGEFQTLGLNNVDPMRLPDGVKMVRELERGGLSPDKAIERAKEFISSGATPPVATPLDITDKLVKVVPTGGQPSLGTGYWMRESELPILQKDPASMSNKLGLPPGMQVESFDVFQITPRQGAVVFESTIAPTTVGGIRNTDGGAKQSIVVDRNQFTPPVKIGSITVK